MLHRKRASTGKARRQRGAVLVEAAITMPVFMLLVFGVIEMSLMFRDHLTVANASRDGARVAAAAGDDLDADFRVLQTIKLSSAVVNTNNIDRIVVYKATSPASVPSAVCMTGTPSPSDDCNVYTSADFTRLASEFGCLSGSATDPDHNFCPAERDTRLNSIGFVGVWINIRHDAVTGFFGDTKQLKDNTVARIEPRRS